MCQITLCNLNNEKLNKSLATILMATGSQIHNDGWGIVGNDGGHIKCDFPAYYTTDMGIAIKDSSTGSKPLLAHIRKASSRVEVNTENAHPFVTDGFMGVHNGTLELKDENGLTLEYKKEIEEWNSHKKEYVKVERTFKVSDSKIFFDAMASMGGINSDETLVHNVRETMSKFYGKFALGIYVPSIKTHYLVRGKTANLYISYMLEDDSKTPEILGFAVNTDKNLLNHSTILLSNLMQLSTGKPLYFSEAEILDEETIYKVRKTSLEKIGEVKENVAPASFTAWSVGKPTTTTSTITSTAEDMDLVTNTGVVFEFLTKNSMGIRDLQCLLSSLYGCSMLEISKVELNHLVSVVIPRLQRLSRKKERKLVCKLSGGLVPFRYYTRESNRYLFPWMINTQERKIQLMEELKGELNI